MNFMDAKTILFSQCWEEAARSCLNKHRFRTHTQQELESFERKCARDSAIIESRLHLIVDQNR